MKTCTALKQNEPCVFNMGSAPKAGRKPRKVTKIGNRDKRLGVTVKHGTNTSGELGSLTKRKDPMDVDVEGYYSGDDGMSKVRAIEKGVNECASTIEVAATVEQGREEK